MYALTKDKPFYCALLLLIVFLWYPPTNHRLYKKWFFGFSAALRTISLLTAMGTFAHLILAIKNNADIDISEDIGDLTGFVGCMTICLNFLMYHSEWAKLFNQLSDFKHFGQPPEYEKVVKQGNFTTLMCIIYTIPGMLSYCCMSYIDIPNCKKNNILKGLNEPCGMINPTWLPLEEMKGTYFIMFYFLQAVGIFIYLPSSFVICTVPWEAVGVIVARINHLKGIFKDVFRQDDEDRCIGQLQYCIQYHQDIIKTSQELSFLVRRTVKNLFLLIAMIIGSLGSQVLKSSTPKAVTFVLGYIMAMFFICHAGQRLIDESLDLTNQIYDSKWYDMKPKIKRDIAFVLARCQKPMTLTGPPSMICLGHVLFNTIIKTSYSYLTLLNEMV
ncbi:hypothetical protein ABEB36_001682 [Hypothenemus hampei]|uniref:Odorant receptor n=1 Tax=Hypothenemus hampei TaxID=57062 RepID=A0ABD1FFF5_HYPHA